MFALEIGGELQDSAGLLGSSLHAAARGTVPPFIFGRVGPAVMCPHRPYVVPCRDLIPNLPAVPVGRPRPRSGVA